MKKLLLFMLPLGIAACGTTPPPPGPYPMTGEKPPAVTGRWLSGSDQTQVRLPETVKEYEFNPYKDASGNRIHEGKMDSVEQSARWDLHPGAVNAQRVVDPTKYQTATRTQVESGPLDAVQELPVRTQTMGAELEQELAKQKEATRLLQEQFAAQQQITAQYQQSVAQAAQLKTEAAQLKQQLDAKNQAEEAKKAADEAEAKKSLWQKWFGK